MAGTDHTVCTAVATPGKQWGQYASGRFEAAWCKPACMYVFEDVDQVKVI